MKGNFRRSMIWLHTYSGLLLSWLIFIVFVTGTLSYYADELDLWMQPERLSQPQYQDVVSTALSTLNTKPEGASRWNINLGNTRDPKAEIQWQYPQQGQRERHKETLSELTEQPRDTLGGDFFVHFHYSLALRQYGGRYLAGIAAFAMLIAVFSGIFTHRRFFKDFFVLRWHNLKRLLTDFHAIIGIVTLPFCIVICLSGLLFYLSLYVPASANYHYDNGYRQLSKNVTPNPFRRPASGQAANPISDIKPIWQQVKQAWPEKHAVSWISYYYPYDKNGYLVFYRNKSDLSRQSETLTFDAASGQRLHQTEPPRIPKLISYLFLGLHEAKFADNSLRFILFILGLLSCALIATGSILWLNHRIERHVSHRGTQLTSWLNKAVLGGLPMGILTLFLANRLLPVSLIDRADHEFIAFLCGWAICAGIAVNHKLRFWRLILNTFAVGTVIILLLDIMMPPHYLLEAFNHHNLTFIAIDVAMLTFGLLAYALRRYLCQKDKPKLKKAHQSSPQKASSC